MTALAEGLRARAQRLAPGHRLIVLAAMVLLCCAVFLFIGIKGGWAFVLPLRLRKLATLALVAFAIGVSSVLFQTATANRLLTPAVMGFDAMYVLIQTCLVFFVGSRRMLGLDAHWVFVAEIGVMVLLSGLLYRALFSSGHSSIHQLVLAGVVIGVLLRSLSSFILRVIDPNEFAFLQDRFFASFNNPDQSLLVMSALIVAGVCAVGWRYLRAFDVLTLGRDTAINLGLAHRRMLSLILMLVAVLVCVSTALVGPVTFFGLLVAQMAYLLMNTHRHTMLIPAAALLGLLFLAGGQIVLEQMLSFDTNLRVVVDFLGGLLFIALLVRGAAR